MVRAKFKCVSNKIQEYEKDVNLRNISLEPVINGSLENEQFFRWTPSGSINLGCVNPNANSQFEVGKEYYVDFTKVGE